MEAKEENLDPNEVALDLETDSDSVDENSLNWLLSRLSYESDDDYDDDYVNETGEDRTFRDLTSWNCQRLPIFGRVFGGVSRNVLNILMKGILFVQEMYDQNWCLMETFHEKFPDKYDFLFERGNPADTIIFQGSASEGLVVYRVNRRDPGTWYNGLRHAGDFDYDVMHVNNDVTVLCNEEHFMPALNYFLGANSNGGRDMAKAQELWKEAKFCLHEKEPWVMLPLHDKTSPYGIVEHVTLSQPACHKCVEKEPSMKNSYIRGGLLGRGFNLKTPYKFLSRFSSRSWKHPSDDHDCDHYHSTDDLLVTTGVGGLNHNRYGDLCLRCKELNSTTVKHEDGSSTHIFLDQVFKYGPSSMKTFYIDNKDKAQYGFPLFNDMDGSSTVMVDNIPALRYPLLD